MDAGVGARGSPGGRPPPKRTYGSKQGSRRTFRPTEASGAGNNSALSAAPSDKSALLPGQKNGRLKDSDASTTGGPLLQLSAGRFGGSVGGGARSAEEVSQLVQEAGGGGESGRASAIALAQACKSRETRKFMRANACGILGEITSVMLASLQPEGGDEALVHGLAVAMFVLSKDRALAKAFTASAVSALALLIEGKGRRAAVVVGEGSVGAHGRMSSAATKTAVPREKSVSFGKAVGTVDDKNSSRSRSSSSISRPSSALQSKRTAKSPFDMSDDDEEDAVVGFAGGFGLGKPLGSGTSRPDERAHRRKLDGSSHGSTTNVTVRARMLLDIADMVPWGMANRHLVSAADLGLATLLNVAAQACPESGERGGGAAGGVAGGGSVDEDLSTQGSMGSQSEPSSAVGALVNGQANGSEVSPAYNAGVMPELSRLAPSGFLLPLVKDGATVLENLTSSSEGRGVGGARASDAVVDPSALRSVHQLLLALRLLDLATLDNSGGGDGAASKGSAGANSAQTSHSHHYAELTGALLVVVAKCQPLCGDGALAPTAACHGNKSKAPPAAVKVGVGREQHSALSSPPAVGSEVVARVHECLLAALRVLINVTHHDARVCAEVASRGGLATLMSCLVARSFSASQGSESSAGSSGGNSRSDLALLEDVVNGTNGDFAESGLGEGGADGEGSVSSGAGDFDAQVLTMSALINCVELKESAENCAAMASLAVRLPPGEGAGEGVFGGEKRKQQQQQPGVGGGLSLSRCLAPQFLAKLLIRCTRSFAHQLETERPDGEGPASPASARAPQLRRATTDSKASRDGADSSTELAAAPGVEPISSATPSTPQVGDGAEQSMSHAEGTDLVLGGHCALLLGLLVRDQERNRRLALPVLPNGDPVLIVRVLEAFMALQFQAGVLTEEIVLAVQGLVEELEGLEALPMQDWNPWEQDATDEDAAVASFPATGAGAGADSAGTAAAAAASGASPQRGRKRPRSPTSSTSVPLGVQRTFATPPSGQWAADAGGGDGSADDFSLSVKRPRTAPPGKCQSPHKQPAPLPPKLSKPPASPSLASTQEASEEQPATPTSSKHSGSNSDAGETPSSRSRTPGSAKGSPSWRVGANSIAGRIGLGLRGRKMAGTRNWIGSSSRLRTYGDRSTYGSQTWKRQPPRSLTELRTSSIFGQAGEEAAAAGQGGESSSAVFEITSDDSDNDAHMSPPRPLGFGGSVGGRGGGGGGGNDGSNAGGGRVRQRTAVATATSSSFDVDDWSDSSNERPVKHSPKKEKKAKGPRVPTCQLQSLASSKGGARGGGGGSSDDGVAAKSRLDKRRRRSPSPSPPPVAVSAKTAMGRMPGQANGGVTSQSPRDGVSRSKEAFESRSGVRPPRSVPPVAGGRREVRGRGAGAGAGAGASRGKVGSGGDARALGGEGASGDENVLAEKAASRSVFDMDDEDESD